MKIINEVSGSELDRKCGQVGAPWVRRGQPLLGSPFHQCHPAGRMGVRGRMERTKVSSAQIPGWSSLLQDSLEQKPNGRLVCTSNGQELLPSVS